VDARDVPLLPATSNAMERDLRAPARNLTLCALHAARADTGYSAPTMLQSPISIEIWVQDARNPRRFDEIPFYIKVYEKRDLGLGPCRSSGGRSRKPETGSRNEGQGGLAGGPCLSSGVREHAVRLARHQSRNVQ
jgi:hypothetical protein